MPLTHSLVTVSLGSSIGRFDARQRSVSARLPSAYRPKAALYRQPHNSRTPWAPGFRSPVPVFLLTSARGFHSPVPGVVAHPCPAEYLILRPRSPLTSALQKTCCRFLSMEACCAATLGPCTFTSQLPPDPSVITSCGRNRTGKGGKLM